ncbi:uncharacterized protein si:ch211-243a20.4 isoform X1 [Ictalurus punctatus]|uniref:Uncharacterized protein si:ch211-243a20.4 isoform X1 n=1 Tax=Ictalurus punctatus TaxID=7998 RepID=A0A2D0Q300_ICTPU|nr:uncharacterized protein si:ch211-243a20.4 isoform X1 [Ictalurus punctatus]
MFTTQVGVFWIILLCFCYKSEAEFSLENRTCVALAGRSVIHQLKVTIPANSTGSTIRCYQNSQKVWEQLIHRSSTPKTIPLTANITMHNSSSSGEYYFQYMDKKLYWVVLVREEGYLPDMETSVIPLLVVLIVLLLFSVAGSVCIFKLYKNHSQSEGEGDKGKTKKRKRNTVATEGATSDSVYMDLEHKTVSVYDVLNVEDKRREIIESQTSVKKAKPSPVEEGIFESVYENL